MPVPGEKAVHGLGRVRGSWTPWLIFAVVGTVASGTASVYEDTTPRWVVVVLAVGVVLVNLWMAVMMAVATRSKRSGKP